MVFVPPEIIKSPLTSFVLLITPPVTLNVALASFIVISESWIDEMVESSISKVPLFIYPVNIDKVFSTTFEKCTNKCCNIMQQIKG